MSRTLKLAGCCLFILLAGMLSTDPHTLPSALLILPFVLVFSTIFLILLSVWAARGVSKAKTGRISLFGAALPTLIIVLQSLGQLTIRDVLTILVLFGMAYFYMTRITGRAES